jgi:hypothetical protein
MKRGWLESIAEKANAPLGEVQSVLAGYRIVPDRPFRPARTISVTAVKFSGEKTGPLPGVFSFTWAPLQSGVWALTSDDNLVGKSSVIEIVLWALRGESRLQKDVESWLNYVRVDIDISGEAYAIAFDVDQGIPKGAIYRFTQGNQTAVSEFDTKEGLSTVVADFFMTALDLDPIPAFEANEFGGKAVEHGWPALSGIMYIGGTHELLIGEIQFSGLPARLLQMYVGIPWARTRMQVGTVQKQLEQANKVRDRVFTIADAERLPSKKKFENDLISARNRLSSLPHPERLVNDTESLAKEIPELLNQLNELESIMRSLHSEEDAALKGLQEDERALQQIKDDQAVAHFFGSLNPKYCPRCDSAIGDERLKAERESGVCSVCDRPIGEDTSLDEERLDSARDRYQASLAALSQVRSAIEPARTKRDQISARVVELRTALGRSRADVLLGEYRAAELEIARLEGALAAMESSEKPPQSSSELAIVDAAAKEALDRFKDARVDLMNELNNETLSLAKRFGISELESVELTTEARMKVIKGGQQTWFSKLTIGERLRLRIATSIALLRVGAKRGVGRHPGLLFIDSPGSEETTDSDFSALVSEIVSVAQELPSLQVFITSARPGDIAAKVPKENLRFAAKGQYLW